MNNFVNILDFLPFFYGYPLITLALRPDCPHSNCLCTGFSKPTRLTQYIDDMITFLLNFVQYYRKNDCVAELKLPYNVQGTYEFFNTDQNKYTYLLKYLHFLLVSEKHQKHANSDYIDAHIVSFIRSLKCIFTPEYISQHSKRNILLPFTVMYDNNNKIVSCEHQEWQFNKIKIFDQNVRENCSCDNDNTCYFCDSIILNDYCECEQCVDGLDHLDIFNLEQKSIEFMCNMYKRVCENWIKFV